MSSFTWIWLAYILITLIARFVYSSRANLDRRQLLDDRRFIQRYLVRPLYLLGEHYDRGRRRRADNGEMVTLFPRHTRLISVPEKPAIDVPPGAKMTIQHSGKPHRCEVCHQDDNFDGETGMCRRCNHVTV